MREMGEIGLKRGWRYYKTLELSLRLDLALHLVVFGDEESDDLDAPVVISDEDSRESEYDLCLLSSLPR